MGVGQALVVGAGPAGLATALMLAQKGWSVEVYERSTDPAAYDPGRKCLTNVLDLEE